MSYDFITNTGDLLESHFRFERYEDGKIALKFIDNYFQKNKRLLVMFRYFKLKPFGIEPNVFNNYINKDGEIILGVRIFTGVQLEREFRMPSDFEGVLVTFNNGARILHEDILVFDTSEEVIKDNMNLQEERFLEKTELRREPISQEVQDRVWNRDGGRCVKCGSCEKLEFDHIIPFSKGGSNTYRNIQLLCEECNRKKSNKIG
ncbi:MAG: hypothetical protein CVU00_09280 [Bacteroidetes bacterium HGW-Bacteroidetes-17]|jgi:hypothetical protein|nr:MAG: hypothetical protein CVU00_09280 [Bacteroidetes bacterium HGW-Bacteroidetes-17]